MLVGLKTIAARFVPVGSTAYEWFEFIGHPFTAIPVACPVAIYGLAVRQGMAKDRVMEICGHALQPAGIILLVIGAGGVFKQVLVDSGVGPALGEALTGMGLPIAITCFVLAAAVRIIQGSATVACLTAVGPVMPVIEQLNYSGAQMAALSICIAGGSIVVSHVNDAGFWLFGKFTGASEARALKTDHDGNHPWHHRGDCRYDRLPAAELSPLISRSREIKAGNAAYPGFFAISRPFPSFPYQLLALISATTMLVSLVSPCCDWVCRFFGKRKSTRFHA